MQDAFFFIGLLLVIGAGGRAVFQAFFLLLGASGQVGASLSKKVYTDEESHKNIEDNIANIKEFNKKRLRVITRFTIAGLIGAGMMYASTFMNK